VTTAFDYVIRLSNAWFLVATAALSINEIAGKFAGWSWSWPRQHRFKAAVAVLMVAQIGAYKSTRDELAGKVSAATSRATAAEARVAKSDAVIDELRKQLSQREAETTTLRDQLANRQPLVIPAPNVNFGANGPLPIYSFCENPGLIMDSFDEWKAFPTCRDVPLPWDEMSDVDVVAEISTRTAEKGRWVQARIWNVTSKTVVVEGTPSTAADYDAGGQRIRLPIPPLREPATYRLEMRNVPGGGGVAYGVLVLSRRHR
jgi:hypothetical protein